MWKWQTFSAIAGISVEIWDTFDEYRRLYLGGRVQDTIRTGGETVLAVEVERAVASHTFIVECAVFPLHHDKYSEAVACALVQCNSKKAKI
jgi:acyl-coenzyme A synthetase/AMP-(fatty) acid ligase